MDIYVQGKKVRLTQADFKAQGGEGAVYVKGHTAYKVYADPAKMIAPAKIQQLSVLTLPEIVRPQEVILDAGRAPIGYTMQSIPQGLVLCQTFPRAFRERVGLTPEKSLGLVRALQKGVHHVHERGLLIVDLNEMNFLVDSSFGRVYFIDVDSYQTPNFPATALMDSVRDRHAGAGWNAGTDWFSFALVSFQMFVGIHPYKGKHPALKTLDDRMMQNVSVLHPDVSVPAACLPFDVIPPTYRDWYRAVLERGERVPPPDSATAVLIVPKPAVLVAGTGQFQISELLRGGGPVLSFTHGITLTTEGIYQNGRRVADAEPGTQIALTDTGRPVRAALDGGHLRLWDITAGVEIPVIATGETLTATDGRLHVKSGDALREVEFLETPGRLLATLKTVGTVLEQATQLFEGVALQNLVGAWYASLLPRRGLCYQVRLPELDGFQVLDAKFQSGVLMVLAVQNGQFQKLIFRFSADCTAHDTRTLPAVAAHALNFTVLSQGMCLHLTESEELELFPAKLGGAGLKVVADPALASDCLLLSDGTQALFARAETLYRFAMR